MLRLLVLRHAKAAPHDEKHDRERPLVARGRDDAARAGRAMRAKAYIPQRVLCSPAARTMQTWEAVAGEMKTSPELEVSEALYDAPEGAILACVRDVKKTAVVVLYVGHNPGLERFARRMVRAPADADERRRCERLALEFPTAALAVIDFDVASWAGIAPAKGVLSEFLTPAELRER
ncbi:MAG: SixA phosphatase family protein [Rhizomicrobium sp.]